MHRYTVVFATTTINVEADTIASALEMAQAQHIALGYAQETMVGFTRKPMLNRERGLAALAEMRAAYGISEPLMLDTDI